MIFKCSLILIYIGYVRPYVTPVQNRVELLNETLILINTYFMIIYSDFVLDPYARSQMGDVNNGILALMILINLFIILHSQVGSIKQSCKRKMGKFKQKQLLKKAENNSCEN